MIHGAPFLHFINPYMEIIQEDIQLFVMQLQDNVTKSLLFFMIIKTDPIFPLLILMSFLYYTICVDRKFTCE